MHLTRHTDFALRLLIHLGRQAPGERLRIAAVAADFDMPHSHLAKIVNQLARLGHVQTQSGRNGGIRLGSGAGAVRLGDLVRQLESNLRLIDCHKPECPAIGGCALPPILNEALEAFLAVLDRYTLADLLAAPAPQRLIPLGPVGGGSS